MGCVPADWTLCAASEPRVYTGDMVSAHARQSSNKVVFDIILHADRALLLQRCATRRVGLCSRSPGCAPERNPGPLFALFCSRGCINHRDGCGCCQNRLSLSCGNRRCCGLSVDLLFILSAAIADSRQPGHPWKIAREPEWRNVELCGEAKEFVTRNIASFIDDYHSWAAVPGCAACE